MTEFEGDSPERVDLSAVQVQELVQRIVASRPFARAPQLKSFLLFIVERAAAGGPGAVTEAEIGRQLLRRGQDDFDPNTDNIVRVQAGHLRRKLEQYFEGEGKDEPLLLTVPKGSYVPRLIARRDAAAPPHLAVTASRRRALASAALALAALVSGFVFGTAFGSPGIEADSPAGPASDILWSTVAKTGRKTFIVFSDTSVSRLRDLLRIPVPLAQYLSPRFGEEILSELEDQRCSEFLERVAHPPYTAQNSAIVVAKLYASAGRSGVDTSLVFPRDITPRQFKSENFVLIGSRRSNPWMELLDGRLNFIEEGDAQNLEFCFRNKAPQPGEQSTYHLKHVSQNEQVTYADIALIPNLDGTGLILCLQGLSGMAFEAAQEIIGNTAASPLHKILRDQPPGALPQLEILVRATGVVNTPSSVQVVATRIGAPGGQP